MWGHQINKTKVRTQPAIESSSKGFIKLTIFGSSIRSNRVYSLWPFLPSRCTLYSLLEVVLCLLTNLFLKVEQTFPAIMQLEELVQNMKGLAELTFTNEWWWHAATYLFCNVSDKCLYILGILNFDNRISYEMNR